MSNFLTDLFQSIFTAGPTPTLLVATNVSFAALQFLLLLLLIATYSIHFLILSFLSAALWYSINWFVAELKAAQAIEEEKKKKREEREVTAEDTETEAETVVESVPEFKERGSSREVPSFKEGGSSREVEVLERRGDVRDRAPVVAPPVSKSETSTEDEWEKVSENENEKDK